MTYELLDDDQYGNERDPLTYDAARALTDRAQAALADYHFLIEIAFRRCADWVLDYSSWEAYVAAEFPPAPRMDKDTRQAMSAKLREAGMSMAQTAVSLGVGKSTVQDDLRREDNPDQPVRNRTDRGDSRIHPENSIACKVERATDAIEEVDSLIVRVLGPIYTLSTRDRDYLRRVLNDALTRLEQYGNPA